MTTLARSAALLLAVASAAHAQPVTAPPLASVQDDTQLARTLAAITQDPAIPVTDPAQRTRAQALMLEGVKQLQAREYDQALANFLEAYAAFPSPKILLNIASTLRDMGRLADAANSYQRYLTDPATGPDRVAEVKELLIALDATLTILTIRVSPRGSDLSIDAGPFITVGNSLQTRVRPGLHLVRVRNGAAQSEVTINGFEGELKEVAATVETPTPTPSPTPTEPAAVPPTTPAHVDAWLATGTQYSSDGGTGNVRKVRAGYAGPEVAAILPTFQTTDGGELVAFVAPRERIHSGVLGVMRVDGKLRGAAGGVGLAIARGPLEADILYLRSDVNGAYLGGRYRLLTGFFRPYIAAGVPGFVYEDADGSTQIAIGVRAAAGLELYVNGHLSVQADLGYEHFFRVADTRYESDVFVPTLGVIGRLCPPGVELLRGSSRPWSSLARRPARHWR